MSEIMNVAVQAARDAGTLLRENEKNISAITTKSDNSLVTNLDGEAEAVIRESIQARFPSHGILAEEGGNSAAKSEYLWIIDPLDGTHNYIRGISLYGVSIGIVKGGAFVAGIIYLPHEDALFAAEHGGGAFRNNERLSVSSTSDLAKCTLVYDSSLHGKAGDKTDTLKSLAMQVFNIRMFGSSVINFAYLAEGKIDAVVEFDDAPWDFAAGVCLVREAGGCIASLDGSELTYNSKGYIASNRAIHDILRAGCAATSG